MAADFNTPITYMPFTVGWDGTWVGDRSITKLGLSVNFHLRDVVGSEAEFANKRFKAHSNYVFLRGNFSHTHTMPPRLGMDGPCELGRLRRNRLSIMSKLSSVG